MRKDTVTYLFDANALIDAGERFYPDDVFPCVWLKLNEELGIARAVTIAAVLRELRDIDPLPAWRDRIITICTPHAYDETEVEVQTEYARLAREAVPGGALPSGLSDVDLFVLAVGGLRALPIVTRDREIRLSCDRGIVATRAIDPLAFLRERGWSFA
ncbi:MAG TPA: DUF4411 family protein [Candidatus Tyrphobacter sp.]